MTKKNSDDKTFVRITNKDIYERILSIDKKLEEFVLTNQQQHSEIIQRQDYTNGKVKLNRWIATTAISITIAVVGALLAGMLRV